MSTADVAARMIESLGSTPDEIAAALRADGVRGVRHNPMRCPLAVFLSKRFPGQQCGVIHNAVIVDGYSATLSPPAAEFMRDFDGDAPLYRSLAVAS